MPDDLEAASAIDSERYRTEECPGCGLMLAQPDTCPNCGAELGRTHQCKRCGYDLFESMEG